MTIMTKNSWKKIKVKLADIEKKEKIMTLTDCKKETKTRVLRTEIWILVVKAWIKDNQQP